MKIIEPSVRLLKTPQTVTDLLKHLEWCGRVCYKSEDKITDNSYIEFIRGVIKRRHGAVLEHGNIIIRDVPVECLDWFEFWKTAYDYTEGNVCYLRNAGGCVSGNIRAWREFLHYATAYESAPTFIQQYFKQYGVLFEDILYDDTPACSVGESIVQSVDECHFGLIHNRCTVHFVVDRGVSHELVRHRPASFLQESTRYCNYLQDKFGFEITVIKPCYFAEGTYSYAVWYDSCVSAQRAYFDLLHNGRTPQEARSVLPNSLKTEVVMTANLSEWAHFINLRSRGTTGTPHPQMREVATQVERLLLDAHPEMERLLG